MRVSKDHKNAMMEVRQGNTVSESARKNILITSN